MSALDALYQQVILDHAKRRVGEGPLEPHDAAHFERNPTCGDELTMRIRLSRPADATGDADATDADATGDVDASRDADTTGDANTTGNADTTGVAGETGARIEALAWEGDGCSISMASASVLSGLAAGATVAETRERIETFREMLRTRTGAEPDEATEDLLEDAVAFRGVAKFVMRVKCAMLSWVALEAALREAGE